MHFSMYYMSLPMSMPQNMKYEIYAFMLNSECAAEPKECSMLPPETKVKSQWGSPTIQEHHVAFPSFRLNAQEAGVMGAVPTRIP